MSQIQSQANMNKRKARVRAKIRGTSQRPRLSVFRSNQHIYAQVIDDESGVTIASANDVELQSKKQTKSKQAQEVGELVAKRAKKAKVKQVCFDRGGYKYQGRIKQLAEAARKQGLEF